LLRMRIIFQCSLDCPHPEQAKRVEGRRIGLPLARVVKLAL
jgi:hypothetical protein